MISRSRCAIGSSAGVAVVPCAVSGGAPHAHPQEPAAEAVAAACCCPRRCAARPAGEPSEIWICGCLSAWLALCGHPCGVQHFLGMVQYVCPCSCIQTHRRALSEYYCTCCWQGSPGGDIAVRASATPLATQELDAFVEQCEPWSAALNLLYFLLLRARPADRMPEVRTDLRLTI